MLAHACSCFALLCFAHAHKCNYVAIKILWKKHRKSSSLLKIFRVNFFFEIKFFLKVIYHSSYILNQIKVIFFGSQLLQKLNSSKQSKARGSKAFSLLMDLALLCFALGLNDPIIDCFHEQSRAKQSKMPEHGP